MKTKSLSGYFCSHTDGEPFKKDDRVIFYKTLSDVKLLTNFSEAYFPVGRYHRVSNGKVDLEGKFITPIKDVKECSRETVKDKRDNAKLLKI